LCQPEKERVDVLLLAEQIENQLPPIRGFIPVAFDNAPKILSSQVPAPLQNRSKTIAYHIVTTNLISGEISYPSGVCVKLNGLIYPELLPSLLLLTQQEDFLPHIGNAVLSVILLLTLLLMQVNYPLISGWLKACFNNFSN